MRHPQPDIPIPLSRIEVWLKQIDRDLLTDFGAKCLEIACPGFMDARQYSEYVGRLRRENPDTQVSGLVKGATLDRRWAGDHSLSRGRYFTLAHDETGADDGTLAAELSAYYEPAKVGRLEVRDFSVASVTGGVVVMMESSDMDPSCALELKFYDVDTLRPWLAPDWRGVSGPLSVLLPLSVTHHDTWAVDLRDPEVANAFAHWFSRLGKSAEHPLPFFKYRPAVDRFTDILATLLTQERGGGVFCKIAGSVLRMMNYPALVYPSARADPGVEVRNGEVVSWRGWCMVNYHESPRPSRFLAVDRSKHWNRVIGEYKGGLALGGSGEFVPYPDVRCIVSSKRECEGSWQVSGLLARLEKRRSEVSQ